MERCQANEEDCEGLVNYALAIEGIEVALFFREQPDGGFRVSLRSKGAVNVAAVAEHFGGGGHECASGCAMPGPLSAATGSSAGAISASRLPRRGAVATRRRTDRALKQNRILSEERTRRSTDILALIAFCGFLFFAGLQVIGLVGADEPRYAQIAREMLQRDDWVTPVLYGQPWLEKPPLYYWSAMLSYKATGGVSDWAARLPSAILCSLMIFFIYVWARHFRRGMQLDAALITAASAIVIGFGRSASTDMPLTAMFTVAMLCWYGWYSNQNRGWLLGFYLFAGLGTLAKGPVAVLLAGLIIVVFAALRRDWRLIVRTLWPVGIALYLAVTLPWFIAVQRANPEFFRTFFLQHNLERFSTNLYHHPQPFWFYLPVALLALVPWTVFVVARSSRCHSRLAFLGTAAARSGRSAHLSHGVVPAADSIFLAVAVEAAGIHSARNSSGHDSAGELYLAPRAGGREAEYVVRNAACTAFSRHAGGSAYCPVQTIEAGSATKCHYRRGRRSASPRFFLSG